MTKSNNTGGAIPDCGECGNGYLAIRTDIHKDRRQFIYCDCCGSMGDLKLWNRANAFMKEKDAKPVRN